LLCQVNGIPPLAHADGQGLTRGDVLGHLYEEGIWSRAKRWHGRRQYAVPAFDFDLLSLLGDDVGAGCDLSGTESFGREHGKISSEQVGVASTGWLLGCPRPELLVDLPRRPLPGGTRLGETGVETPQMDDEYEADYSTGP